MGNYRVSGSKLPITLYHTLNWAVLILLFTGGTNRITNFPCSSVGYRIWALKVKSKSLVGQLSNKLLFYTTLP